MRARIRATAVRPLAETTPEVAAPLVARLQSSSPSLYWVVLVSLRLWLQVGFYMVLFLAGLQAMRPEIDEAAALDGATGRRLLTRITLPMLRNTAVTAPVSTLLASAAGYALARIPVPGAVCPSPSRLSS
ncbi:ABC transporter permease subunit [Streptomyces sp. NPDC055721]|uniref:ABC transporter permease subunit n=1 Tax=Streptomyces sp. NPDC127132 TaxID=3345374 RepID=UPI00362FB8F1